MAEPAKKKKKGFFQKVAQLVKDLVEWVEETFSDPELAAEIRDDLGLDRDNPATPATPDGARMARIEAFAAKEDVDEASLLAVVADIKAEVDAIIDFIEAAKADQVDARVLFATMFKLFAVDLLRVRNPSAYALVRLAGLVLDDEEFLQQLDAAALQQLVRGEGPAVDGEVWVQRLSMLGGVTLVVLATVLDRFDAVIDAVYGWDPDPEDEGESAAIASRALTVMLDREVLGTARPVLTLIPVPRGHGESGMYVGGTAGVSLPTTVGSTTYTFDITGAGQFGLFVPFDFGGVRSFASFTPSIRVGAEPYKGGATDPGGNPIPAPPMDTPALVVGATDGSRLEVGALAYGIEISGEDAVFRLTVRNGKLVIALGEGDAFLRQLPGGNVEAPFDVSLVGSTSTGVHFQGGTRLRVNLPVSASLFGVFTVQFLELELVMEPEVSLDIRGGFSLTLGPFAASIDRVGVSLALQRLGDDIEHLGDFVRFAPPRGIGLVLDAGVVKGGGFLFIDSAKGEYAGALELKFLTWSIKAIGLLSTKRPDGSDGWSLLLFVFGQFNVHLAFGIFWTGAGGMIGLHHRSDVGALTTGMRTGALDDVLFPKNPVADAPRIINRYRTLFPVADGNLLIGPMLELSFSEPPIVFVRLGLIFDVRNALSAGPATMSKVVLVGQVLVQLPPRDTGVPAILKLLIDVVGYYDGDTRFLLVRARLRDSFVGIEGFVKLDLAGELLVAAQFGPNPAFVLSAGGFHPRYVGLPERVPRDLDKLRVSFKLGPVSLSIEHYFAVTPNSVQAGQKTSLKADFGVAKIEASLGWDALLFLSPRFFFIVDLEFKAKVKAFGRTLASVTVTATLQGPDEWRFDGTFSFSILWWDKTVPFHEHFGEVRQAETGTVSLGQVLQAELANPDNVTIEAPTGANPVTLTSPGGAKLAHPVGRLAVRQRAVPLGLRVERLGTRDVAGGPQVATVVTVALNDETRPGFEHTTEQFSRGQFATLSDDEKLTGPTFETFPAGVIVGSADYVAADALARDVAAGFETVRLDPEPAGLVSKWTTAVLSFQRATDEGAGAASKLGAAARSDRAEATLRLASSLAASGIGVDEPPLALVGPASLAESAALPDAAVTSPSLAAQVAAAAGTAGRRALRGDGVSTPAVYRFLPFTRRGLVAELRDSTAAAEGELPQRASIKLDLTLSDGLGGASTTTALAGPGDVVGLDPRSIVRLTPRRDATNVEPNYLVAVDFDEPDLPWLLTPAAADAQGRLRPWLALVVVEARPGVTIDVPGGAPLPQLRIDGGARRELGDLTGSWAWAHTQLLVAEGSGGQAAGTLQSDPDRHVSRLLCPRRLRAGGRWFACLVPAFDAGVRRGLGLAPLADRPMLPAWSDEDEITLPLYFHWEFSTGPAGDFESLARRLQPFKVGDGSDGTPTVGTVKLHIGAAGGPVDLPDGHPERIVEMDGALRAVQQLDGRLEDIPTALTTPLGELLDAIADPSGSDPDDGAVGPPLYGAWAINRFRLPTASGWFRELNLDPRTRVAAGLGAEVVRREQEDLMTACWEQVGSVLAANTLLARAELSIQASTRLHLRSIARLAPARALTYAAPLAGRAPLGEATVRAAITPTSLPDTTIDPALRRLLAPTGRFIRKATADRPAAAEVSARFVDKLAAGSMAVDPTDFVPAGVLPPSAEPPPPPPPPEQRLTLQADLRTVGLITSRHAELVRANGEVFVVAGRQVDPLLALRAVAVTRGAPDSGFVLGKIVGGGLGVDVVGLLRPPGSVRPGRLPGDVLRRPGDDDVVVDRPPIGRPPIDRPPITPPADRTEIFEGPTVTVPPLVRDALVLDRFEAAIAQIADVGTLADAPPGRELVPYALGAAAQSLIARCHPSNAHVARVGSMVHFGDTSLADLRAGMTRDGVTVAPTFDRIMAYPELPVPAYRLLARYDRTRLLPGVDAIPPDSVTLLETNPRFVAAFLAGVNHEVNRELLWRRYPTDQRGTPVRRFWDRSGGPSDTDVPPMHQWAGERSLVQVAGDESNLVLLIRGELLRRYPNTVALAIPASGPGTPSSDETMVKRASFAGFLDPDVTFFGFDLVDDDLRQGDGWFFALQEQITEPRFGLDESRPEGALTAWRTAAWPDTGIVADAPFTVEDLRRFAAASGLQPVPTDGATVAEALFQNPVQVLVHARHLTFGEEA